jgi:hypothetical protein
MIIIVIGIVIGAIVCRLILYRFRNKEWYFYLWLPIAIVSSLWLFNLVPIIGKNYASGMAGGMDIMLDIYRLYFGAPMISVFMGCLISPPKIHALSFKTISRTIAISCSILFLFNLAMKSRKVNFQIIDQFAQPVSAAEFDCHTNNDSFISLIMPFDESNIKAKTDSNGACVVRYYFFQKLYIDKIEKEGYEFKWRRWNAKLHNSNTNEIKINAWKRGDTIPLQKQKLKLDVTTDNQEYFINLTTGKTKKGYDILFIADLKLRMLSFGRHDWIVSIEAIEGGLIITDDDFLYYAPEFGYENKIELKKERNIRSRKLYLKSRNGGVYSALKVNIYNYPDQRGRIKIESISNINGNRNLEWNPNAYR